VTLWRGNQKIISARQSGCPSSAPNALDATLLPFQLLVAVTLVGFDLARQRNVSIEGQVGYRNEMRYRCISAADIQAAENSSLVPTVKNINDIALLRNWNIRRLLC